MSSGPVSLPHINFHRSQNQGDGTFQALPPMQQAPPQQSNNYYHDRSYPRDGPRSEGPGRAQLSPGVTSGATPMFIDNPPSRTTLPPIETQFDPAVRRGSITDPSMHATSSNDAYRNSNGSNSRAPQGYRSYPVNPGSRPHSLQDDRPPSPESFDSDSQHGGYTDRQHSLVSDQHPHVSLSRKSSASGWSRVNGNADSVSLKGFDSRIAHLQLDSTTSLASTSTTASNRPGPSSASVHSSRAQQYIQDYDNPPHRRITPHLAPPISTTAPGTFAERYPQSRTYPYPHPNAPHPTPGYPYAFPDPSFEATREPQSASSTGSHSQTLHYQRSLPSLHPVHEQSIRDTDMSGIMGPGGLAPYSRSPELRVSHKLAERKRRREMKDLFDELRDSLPVDKTLKTSKWEILSKAIEYIAGLKHDRDAMQYEIDALRRQIHQQR